MHYSVQIRTESSAIDSGSSSCGIGDGRARHKAAPPNGPQFAYRRAVTAHDDGSSGLYFTKDRGGLIAKLSLGDGAALHTGHCSIRSTLRQTGPPILARQIDQGRP